MKWIRTGSNWFAVAQAFVCLFPLLLASCQQQVGSTQKLDTKPVETSAETPAEKKTSITIAAASDLKFALEEIVREFKTTHPGIQVETTFGSSGNFYQQLSNKAPFDLFLSADLQFPKMLIDHDFAAKDSEFSYAVGHLVLWVRNESSLDLNKGIAVLKDSNVKKIAIANPKVAPYGRAAEAALKQFEIYDDVKDRLVIGENIAQATQFVESGAADIGIIARSLALSPTLKEKGRLFDLPAESHPKLEQGGIIMNWAKNPDACRQFRDFMISDQSKAILVRFGFESP